MDGEPTFIETFRVAVSEYGFTQNVRILRCPSQYSEAYLAEHFADPDLFYIDADHTTPAVLRDIDTASRLTPRGLIAGDDWCWPSVQRAVLRSAIRLRMSIFAAQDDFAWALISKQHSHITQELVKRGWRERNIALVIAFLLYHRITQVLRKYSEK